MSEFLLQPDLSPPARLFDGGLYGRQLNTPISFNNDIDFKLVGDYARLAIGENGLWVFSPLNRECTVSSVSMVY